MSAVEERGVPPASAAAAANYPWLLIGLLWAAAFLNSAGRQILITVLPQIRAEFGLSATQLALINSIGFWIYAVGSLIFGRLGDGTHRSRLIAGGLALLIAGILIAVVARYVARIQPLRAEEVGSFNPSNSR